MIKSSVFGFFLFKATEYIYVIDTVINEMKCRKPNQFFRLMKIGITIILKLQWVVVV